MAITWVLLVVLTMILEKPPVARTWKLTPSGPFHDIFRADIWLELAMNGSEGQMRPATVSMTYDFSCRDMNGADTRRVWESSAQVELWQRMAPIQIKAVSPSIESKGVQLLFGCSRVTKATYPGLIPTGSEIILSGRPDPARQGATLLLCVFRLLGKWHEDTQLIIGNLVFSPRGLSFDSKER
jgi:hypothetical protein